MIVIVTREEEWASQSTESDVQVTMVWEKVSKESYIHTHTRKHTPFASWTEAMIEASTLGAARTSTFEKDNTIGHVVVGKVGI